MVLAGKVFVIREEAGLDDIAAKLRDFKVEEEKGDIKLVREVRDIKIKGEDLHAIFSQDQVREIYHRGKKISTPCTLETPIVFSKFKKKIFLIVVEKKPLANSIANQLSKILFIVPGVIVEAKIPPDAFRRFHEEHFEDTKIIFFDDVDIPNVDKLSLYGSALADTGLYHDYLKHGKVWYIVIKPKEYNSIIGITRNSVITFFSKAEVSDLIEYIKREILPLIPQG
jgi:hypothetical protein